MSNNINPILLMEDGLWYGLKQTATAPVRAVRNFFRRNYNNQQETEDYNTYGNNAESWAKMAAKTDNPILRERYLDKYRQASYREREIESRTNRGVRAGRSNVGGGFSGKVRAKWNRLWR